jgi:NAD(P)-dependent dehydrogenase (short-subunit alcohol dehydrogenase family)
MPGRLSGKVALVTGIGSGIGQGCARLFAMEGAKVIGCDINPAKAEAFIAEARTQGLDIESVHPIDLTLPDDVKRYVEDAVSRHGRIDALVNAAAIQPHMARTDSMDYEREWVPTMVGEVDIVFLVSKAAWPHLVASGGGAIVNFASVNAQRGSAGLGMVAHCAGKGAVLAMTRQMAIEGGPDGIRVNSISPGLVVTDATRAAGAAEGEHKERILSRFAIKRLGKPEDIGWCAVYLCSDEAEWVTGANFNIDGGAMAS